MVDNYVCYHLHSDLSNGVTNIDSVTKFTDYVERAKECGMKALGFSEHGSVFEWWHKKCAIEAAGMKYIHAAECYLTFTLDEKIRDNYHIVLIARNYAGVLELNRLISKSFCRSDNHFYYVPRISFDELSHTSDNIIVTTACVGGVFGKYLGQYEDNDPANILDRVFLDNCIAQNLFEEFLVKNKERCFLEIGHHKDPKQVRYNQHIVALHEKTGVRLIAGTDTHALNDEHARCRIILQKAKNIHFDGEDMWDLRFKTFEELVFSYKDQDSISEEMYMSAIENTNLMADMIEPFEVDRSPKYPHIYEHPEETFRKKVYDAVETHPYALKRHGREALMRRVDDEISVYEKTKSIDFMLMQTYLREWENEHGIQSGYGRGSVSGSMVAYLLGITCMDSMKYDLNFFRFMNPARVSLADIDTDYAGKDRDIVKAFVLKDKMGLNNIKSSEIITFNTIALKGAIRDVVRSMYKNDRSKNYITLSEEIIKLAEADEEKARKKYPDIFKVVDVVSGVIVSIGTHPSGVLVSDLNIEEFIGMCSVSTSDYQVSMLNMKELDDLMCVKLDLLGLDNLGVINDTCKMLGIDRLTPDNVDDEDENVWKSMRDDTTLIFQWERESASLYMKKLFSDSTIERAKRQIPKFSMLRWFALGNGLLRPGCASFRDSIAEGVFYDNGFDELNKFLAPEAGRIAMQETIMQFLVRFCGYSDADSDLVRRGIAKKKGTEKLLPEIERRFIEYAPKHYDISKEKCEEIIKPFIQIILDASAYSFSWNHAEPYGYIGYISGYLRYYYPLEFLTASLNTFFDDSEKTADITKYASKNGIQIIMPKWGFSKDVYVCDTDKRVISKGLASVKYINAKIANQLYDIAHEKEYDSFVEVLSTLSEKTTLDSRQLDTLIKLDFFSDFGNQRELIRIAEMFTELFKKGDCKVLSRDKVDGTPLEPIVQKYSTCTTKAGTPAQRYTLTDINAIMRECEQMIKQAKIPDLDVMLKARNFADIMGYAGYVSGNDEDRPKLYVMGIYPLKRKSDKKKFGYSVITRSIGSGKETRFTVFNAVYDKSPVAEGDIIQCTSYARDGIYFRMTGYVILSKAGGKK